MSIPEVFTDARCLLHRAPPGYPERPERLERVLAGCESAGFALREAGRHAQAVAAVDAVHGRAYRERLARSAARGDGLIDSSDNPLGPGTLEAAWAAVETVLHAADWIAGGAGRAAFAAVRPPGHHAERQTAMGFCYFNNVAVAAEDLRTRQGMGRVAIFDFDVHHGNGTQHLFEEAADVFYASTHQWPFYPGTGAASERGVGGGEGATLNVPLPAGSGDAAYREAIDGAVLPAIRRFAPRALLVSVGLDAWRGDPLGGMRVTREAFLEWGRAIGAMARDVCEGRVLSVLEGGYDLQALGNLTAAYLEGLADGLG
jgi:acetoin utilization deacetylase AcuC-like enzyme